VVGQYFTGVSSHAFIGQGPSSTPLLSISIRNTSTGEPLVSTAYRYDGPVAGLQNEYINITADNLYISAASDNWFIHSGSGQDAIAVHGGTNVLDGGAGSNFMVGGSGTDMFFADERGATTDIWSTLVGVHAGDRCTIWGLTPQDFILDWTDGQGAAGFTGLTLHALAPGQPVVSMTLVGYSMADRDNGRLSVTFGTEAMSGSAYMLIQASA
jgi:serralysin